MTIELAQAHVDDLRREAQRASRVASVRVPTRHRLAALVRRVSR